MEADVQDQIPDDGTDRRLFPGLAAASPAALAIAKLKVPDYKVVSRYKCSGWIDSNAWR